MLKVKSFISALKITWVNRYRNEGNGIWKIFFDYYLDEFGGQFLFDCNFRSTDMDYIGNTFIKTFVKPGVP